MPSKFYSDNGRTYSGANSELRELGNFLIKDEEDVERSCVNENFNWIFLPPYSPNIGGIWEAGIKSCKFHLKRVVGDAALTYEQFYSILVQIEGILNSRPLTPLSNQAKTITYLSLHHTS
uniref:Integrase catalytic domain-containing protein n=1 Tax=Anoplophora glabripennis TaxID=217634 RepID=V5G0F5_ANOGL